MKEVKLKFKDLSQTRRDAIITLRQWLFDMYKSGEIPDTYQLYIWLGEVISHHQLLSATDMQTLRELWDVYVKYKKEENAR